MKASKILMTGLLMISVFSCSPDKQSQLNDLYSKQKTINEKIKKLEAEIDGKEIDSLTNNGVLVTATKINFGEFNHYIEIQGKVDADKNVAIYPESMGIIDEIYVKSGNRVKNGQVLAKLDDSILKKNLKDLESSYQFANEIYNKQKNLWDQKIGSEVQYLTAKNNKESLENKIALLKEQIDKLSIKAPVAGEIEEITCKVGQSVSNIAPVFRIVNFSGLKVTAEVAEGYASNVKKGDKVLVHIPDLKKEYTGIVNFVGNFIDPINRTFQIEVRLNQVYSQLKANMITVVKINDYKARETVVLPINIIMNDQKGSFVYTVKKNNGKLVASRTNVKTGVTYNGEIEVIDGLTQGDEVITVGFQDLENGKAIRL